MLISLYQIFVLHPIRTIQSIVKVTDVHAFQFSIVRMSQTPFSFSHLAAASVM